MKIVTLYKTSRGFFKDKEEAEKKKNREEYYDRGFPVGQYEPVEEVRAIESITNPSRFSTKTEYFLLKSIKVK